MVMVRIVAAAVNWVGLMVQNHCCEIRVIFLSLRNVLVCILACPFTELKIMQPEKMKGSVKDVLLALRELNKKAEDVQSSGRKANEILWSRRVQEKSLCRRRRESKKGDKKECSSCFCFFFLQQVTIGRPAQSSPSFGPFYSMPHSLQVFGTSSAYRTPFFWISRLTRKLSLVVETL